MENDSFDDIIQRACGSQDESAPELMDTLPGLIASLSRHPATPPPIVADAASGGSAESVDPAGNRRPPSPITWDEMVEKHRAAEEKKRRYRAARDREQEEEKRKKAAAADAAADASVCLKDIPPKKSSAKEYEAESDDEERGVRSWKKSTSTPAPQRPEVSGSQRKRDAETMSSGRKNEGPANLSRQPPHKTTKTMCQG